MTILLTGGAGYIGSHISLSLLERGSNLIVLDSFINCKLDIFDRVYCILKEKGLFLKNNIKVIKGDIRDKNLLRKIFFDQKLVKKPIDTVIHCAGLKSVRESVINPKRYWDINFEGSKILFSVMTEFDCKKIVFSSSASVYGSSCDGIFSEESEINPSNPYGETKFAIENHLFDITKKKNNDWKILNLRYFNPVGAHSSGLIGDDPVIKNRNIFPILNEVASRKKKELFIFGKSWNTFDGTCIRDYIHVEDLAEAHVKGLDYLSKTKRNFTTINVGTGLGTSVLELVNSFKEINKCQIPIKYVAKREGDVGVLIAKVDLASKVLGWTAKRSLKDICKDNWRWQKRNFK